MHEELKNFHTPTVTDNAEENVNTFYNDRNTIKKQLDPY